MLKKLTANSENLTKSELNETKAGSWMSCMAYLYQTARDCNNVYGTDDGAMYIHELCRASNGGLF